MSMPLLMQPVAQARRDGIAGRDFFAAGPIFSTISRMAGALRGSPAGVSVIDHDPGDER